MRKRVKSAGGGGFRLFRGRKATKYMIIFVGAVMLFSGLYMGFNREEPAVETQDQTASWNVVKFDSAELYSEGLLTEVATETNEYKLMPKNPGQLSQDSITYVFESNITGVNNIVLETAQGYDMFHISTDGREVDAEIRKRIRLPGGYNLYRVYKSSTQYGDIGVIGEGLKVGDFVRVLILQRMREGKGELLGFAQKKVPAGPIVDARVVGLENLRVSGVSSASLSEGDLEGALNVSDIAVEEGNGSWSVSFEMPFDSDTGVVKGVLKERGVSNVSFGISGYSQTPEEMVMEGRIVAIPGYERVQTVFESGTKVNDSVRVRIYMMSVGNTSIAFAIEASGNGTEAL
ncbi:MAG: hypothetical protein V1744_07550 [Candidatus Altiarchaeota archaeon]